MCMCVCEKEEVWDIRLLVLETYVDLGLGLEVLHDGGEKFHLLLGERGLGRVVLAGRGHFGFGFQGLFCQERGISMNTDKVVEMCVAVEFWGVWLP